MPAMASAACSRVIVANLVSGALPLLGGFVGDWM